MSQDKNNSGNQTPSNSSNGNQTPPNSSTRRHINDMLRIRNPERESHDAFEIKGIVCFYCQESIMGNDINDAESNLAQHILHCSQRPVEGNILPVGEEYYSALEEDFFEED